MGPIISSCKSVAVISVIFNSFPIWSLTYSYEILPFFESGNLRSSILSISSVLIKIQLYTSKVVDPNIQFPLI